MSTMDPFQFPGTEGTVIKVQTNMFPFKIIGTQVGVNVVYGYTLYDATNTEGTKSCQIPSDKVFRNFKETFKGYERNYIFVPGYPQENVLIVYSIPPLPPHPITKRARKSRFTIEVILEPLRTLDISNVQMGNDFDQFLKVGALKHIALLFAKRDFKILRDSFFPFGADTQSIIKLNGALDLLSGYKMRFHTDRKDKKHISVNTVQTIVARRNVSLLQFFVTLILNEELTDENFHPEDFRGYFLDPAIAHRLENACKGLTCCVINQSQRNDCNVYYKIHSIHSGPSSQMRLPNGQFVNDYYSRTCRVSLRLPDLNAVGVINRKNGSPKYVPFELVMIADRPQRITGALLQDYQSVMMRTALGPVSKFEAVKQFSHMLASDLASPDAPKLLTEIGFEIDPENITVDARLLERPTVSQVTRPNCLFKPVNTPIEFVVFDFHNEMYGRGNSVSAVKNLVEKFYSYGMFFPKTEPLFRTRVHTPSRTEFNADHAMEDMMDEFWASGRVKYAKALIFFVIIDGEAESSSLLHAAAKKVFDRNGFISQVIHYQTLRSTVPDSEKTQQELEMEDCTFNLCLKVNAKLGGINFVYNNGPESLILPTRYVTMYIGIDTRLSSEKDNPGLVALITSLDERCVRFRAHASMTNGDTRYSTDFSESLPEALHYFRGGSRDGSHLPQHIVIYRNGMSEYDTQTARGEAMVELKHIDHVLGEHYAKFRKSIPKLSYIGYHRAHNIRFMKDSTDCKDFDYDQEERNYAERGEEYRRKHFGRHNSSESELRMNVPVGTVIDHTITNENCFFLVSHKAASGTTKPAKYTIVADNLPFEANDLLKITYILCNLNPRCGQSVRSPVMLRLASLLLSRIVEVQPDIFDKYRVCQVFHIHKELRHELFYL